MFKCVSPAGREINRDRLQSGEGWNGFTAGFLTGGLSGVAWAYILTQVSPSTKRTWLLMHASWLLDTALPCIYFCFEMHSVMQHSTVLMTSPSTPQTLPYYQ